MKQRTPADYIEDRLLLGGALVFCSAVLVQTMQFHPLTNALWVSLAACAFAIPSLAGALLIFAIHEKFSTRVDTKYSKALAHLGAWSTFACIASIFFNFHWALGAIFVSFSFVSFGLSALDFRHHQNINNHEKR